MDEMPQQMFSKHACLTADFYHAAEISEDIGIEMPTNGTMI